MFRLALCCSSLRQKCPNTEFFLVRIFPYSVQIREDTDQKKLLIWALLMQCLMFFNQENLNNYSFFVFL